MKKRIAVLGVVLCLALTGCGGAASSAEPSATVPILPVLPTDPSAPSETPSQPVPELPDERPTEPPANEQPSSPEEPPANEHPSSPEQPPASEQPSSPEQPPAPTVQKDVLLRSTTDGLRVRKGAGTSYASIGTLDKGDMVMPVRKTGGWYEVRYMGGSGYVSASYVTSVSFTKGSAAVEKVIDEGKKLLGMPYVFGAQRYHWGNGVKNTQYDGKSYDCSSFMQYIFKIGANVNLAMTSREQSTKGTAVARGSIRRGDLLFFTNASRQNKTGIERIGHVALYLGDNIILHTASDHAVIEPISAARQSYYVCARRMIRSV